MTDPSLALQKAIRTRLIASPAVIALVPAGAIFDRSARPEAFPCIIIGEGTTLFGDNFDSFYDRHTADLHLWEKESGLTKIKDIAGAVRSALEPRPWQIDGFLCPTFRVLTARYIRDPSGEHSHVVLTVEAFLQKVAA